MLTYEHSSVPKEYTRLANLAVTQKLRSLQVVRGHHKRYTPHIQGWVTHRVSKSKGTSHGCISRSPFVPLQENEAEGIPHCVSCSDFRYFRSK